MKPELEFGRKVIAWDKGIKKTGLYIAKDKPGHCILTERGTIMTLPNAKPDLTAPPMNGDEVECLRHHDNRWVTARFVGLNSIKEPVVDVGDGVPVRALKVRHPQQSKRERMKRVKDLLRNYPMTNYNELAEKIDQIYKKES